MAELVESQLVKALRLLSIEKPENNIAMVIPFDVDLPIFAIATFKILFGGRQRAQQNQRAIPVDLQIEEMKESALSEAQREYIRPFDEKLAALNYRPLCNTRVTNFRNYGFNLSRHYHNPADSVSCVLTIIELKAKSGSVEAVKTSSLVAFTTRFSDGTLLLTRSLTSKSLMDDPPWRITQDFRQVSDLAVLKQRHDSRASSLGTPNPPAADVEQISERQRAEHRRFSEYQLARGIYQLLPDHTAYEATDKTRLRGIWNHYNPFAQRISWTETILTALIACVLPLVTILKLAPACEARLGLAPARSHLTIGKLLIFAAYLLAGVLVGWISQRFTFHWAMLCSYFPAHLLAGWTFGWYPYTTLMYVTAFGIIQSKRRRAVIFEPRPPGKI